jgi:hypothetical protein
MTIENWSAVDLVLHSAVVSGILELRGDSRERGRLWKECVWRYVASVGVNVYHTFKNWVGLYSMFVIYLVALFCFKVYVVFFCGVH